VKLREGEIADEKLLDSDMLNHDYTDYKVEVNTDKVKLDKQHREYRWINTMEDGLHPYPGSNIYSTRE